MECATKIRKNMRDWIVFLGIVVLVWACAQQTTAEGEEKAPISGATIYQKRCVLCHGADGRMGMNGAKILPESTLSIEERIQVVTNGRGIMPAFGEQISRAEIEAVAKFTTTLE